MSRFSNADYLEILRKHAAAAGHHSAEVLDNPVGCAIGQTADTARRERLANMYRRIADLHEEAKLMADADGVDLGADALEPMHALFHARAMAAQALAEVVSGRVK